MSGRIISVAVFLVVSGCGGGDDDGGGAVDAGSSSADATANASPCAPSSIAPADDPVFAGDKYTNVTFDPGTGNCALDNAETPTNHVMSIIIPGEMPGTCPARPDWELVSSSHGPASGVGCFGPIPNNTDVTIRAHNSTLSLTLDITVRRDSGTGMVYVPALSVVP